MGNFEAMRNYLVQSQSELIILVEDAIELSMVSKAESRKDFLINLVGSTIGTVAVLVGSFGVRVYLKKKYPSDGGQEFGSFAA